MGNIGLILKKARQEQNIKQVNLAKGICSISYLSKIENSQIQPNGEIISALLEKLSLTIKKVSYEEELAFLANTQTIYKEAVLFRDKGFIEKEVSEIEQQKVIFNSHSNLLTHILMLCRMYILQGNEINKVTSLLEYLELQRESLSNYQKCKLYINKSLKAFYLEEYPEAVMYSEKALEYKQTIVMEKWELADLYNVLAICYLINNFNYSAIEFASKALTIYRDLLLFNRAIDCHITIGIGHKRNYKYIDSEEHYNAAYLLLEDRGLFEFEGILTQNLGTLFAVQGDSEKSISYFLTSLVSSKTTEGYLVTIFSIIKEYSKLNDFENVLRWCKRGLNFQSIDSEQNTSFYFHFNIFESIHLETKDLTSVLIKAIKYFESKNDFRHVYKYSTLLANYCFKTKKMKKAGVYYQLASQALLNDKKILKWEDL